MVTDGQVPCRYCGESHATREMALCRRVFLAVQQEEQAHRAQCATERRLHAAAAFILRWRAASQGFLAHRVAVLDGKALDAYLMTVGQQSREGR